LIRFFIFFAPWCGHCKASKDEFEKAAEMNQMIILVDSTQPENEGLKEKYGVQGFPTIMKASGEKYTGARTAVAIDEFQKK
jgi:thiol-disulfide isomerase/thioredoxin